MFSLAFGFMEMTKPPELSI